MYTNISILFLFGSRNSSSKIFAKTGFLLLSKGSFPSTFLFAFWKIPKILLYKEKNSFSGKGSKFFNVSFK
ncbi:hypothetical protein MHBO_000450 [Bonamia ostreae]|uniref:Ribosomal protein L32 n=1 Tax=Bonamia ostreae TaxID=126728 RepID=A0ABV2AGV5_9EUKA